MVTHITRGNFAQSSITINEWLCDFLWAQGSQVIQSYPSSLSAYDLLFLGAHFVWAISLMFLFSGCVYWEKLIESIAWTHNKLKATSAIKAQSLEYYPRMYYRSSSLPLIRVSRVKGKNLFEIVGSEPYLNYVNIIYT